MGRKRGGVGGRKVGGVRRKGEGKSNYSIHIPRVHADN